MRGIDVRKLLEGLLQECLLCSEIFAENVALLRDGDEPLSEDDAEMVLIILNEKHQEHASGSFLL